MHAGLRLLMRLMRTTQHASIRFVQSCWHRCRPQGRFQMCSCMTTRAPSACTSAAGAKLTTLHGLPISMMANSIKQMLHRSIVTKTWTSA